MGYGKKHWAVGAATAIGNAYHTYNKYKPYVQHGLKLASKASKYMQTRSKTKSATAKRKRKIASSGKGRSFGSGLMGGRVRRKRRVKRRGKVSKMLSGGIYLTQERSVVQTSGTCVYIGHCSVPVREGTLIVCMALVKAVCNSLGINANDFNENTDGFTFNDRLWINYTNFTGPSATVSSVQFSLTGISYFTLANNMANFFQGLNENAEITQVYFQPDVLVSGIAKKLWNMQNASFTIYAKSDLKFQNRSVNETGDEDAEDVDNVPLIGRGYSGNGTGTTYNGGTIGVRPFYCDRYGLLSKDGDVGKSLKEPPFGQLFQRVKKVGGVSVQPGGIKTSTLTTRITMGFNTWIRKQLNTEYFQDYPIGHLGKFEFYALEKIIGGLSAQTIQVAAEKNLLIGCQFKLGAMKYTSMIYDASVATEE